MVTMQKYALNEAPQLLWVYACVAEHAWARLCVCSVYGLLAITLKAALD